MAEPRPVRRPRTGDLTRAATAAALVVFLAVVGASAVLMFTPHSDPGWAVVVVVAGCLLAAGAGLPGLVREIVREPAGALFRVQDQLRDRSSFAVMGSAILLVHAIADRRPEVLWPAFVCSVLVGQGPLAVWWLKRRRLPNQGRNLERWGRIR